MVITSSCPKHKSIYSLFTINYFVLHILKSIEVANFNNLCINIRFIHKTLWKCLYFTIFFFRKRVRIKWNINKVHHTGFFFFYFNCIFLTYFLKTLFLSPLSLDTESFCSFKVLKPLWYISNVRKGLETDLSVTNYCYKYVNITQINIVPSPWFYNLPSKYLKRLVQNQI